MDKHESGYVHQRGFPGDDSPFKVLKLGLKSAFNILGCRRALRVGKKRFRACSLKTPLEEEEEATTSDMCKSESETKRRTQLLLFFLYKPTGGSRLPNRMWARCQGGRLLSNGRCQGGHITRDPEGGPAGSGGEAPEGRSA